MFIFIFVVLFPFLFSFHSLSSFDSPKDESHIGSGQDNRAVRTRSILDEKVKEMKDQVIRAKTYLNFTPANSSSHFVRELKLRIKELERAASQSTKDSHISRRYGIC